MVPGVVMSRRAADGLRWVRRGALRLRHPAQLIAAAYAVGIAAGTLLLSLPVARAGPGGADVAEALFTATSALCVTGLVVVDTASYWSYFGESVILTLIQVGGFGIMTLASLLGLLISRRMGLRSRLIAAAESPGTGLGDVRTVVVGVVTLSLVVQAATAVLLALRLGVAYGEPPLRAAWLGWFHAVSGFNNAGFALYPDSLMRFAADPWFCLPLAAAVILGGLGFPVLFELQRRPREPRHWSLHTKITLVTSAVLLVAGTVFITAAEWGNTGTLGSLDPPARLLAGFFQSAMTRTAGFNSVDIAQLGSGTWLAMSVLMFIGTGSGGTGGGIKVTTFAVLLLAIRAEIRGDTSVDAFRRRIPDQAQRVALSVALLAVAAVVAPTLVLVQITGIRLDEVLFEVVSAFATTGLSTGITDDLPPTGRGLLMILMFAGRLGPVTLATALALRERGRLYSLPEGSLIIG